MKKTIDELRWGSRVILPEHREAMLKQQRDGMRKQRVAHDEQQIEQFAYIIQESMMERRFVKVVVFDEFEDRELKGIITHVDQGNRRICIQYEHDFEYIKLDDLLDIFFI